MERDQLIGAATAPDQRGTRASSGPLVSLFSASCVFYLVVVGALALAALVPPLFGLSATTIVSGSMRPVVNVGDVILAETVDDDDVGRLRVGDVITFRDVEHDRLVTHRIAEVLDDSFRTRGDANRDVDPVPVAADQIVARPVVLIPMAGLPARWLSTGAYARFAGWVLVTMAAVVAARAQRYRPRHLERPAISRGVVPTAVVLAVVGAALHGQTTAGAVFTAVRENPGNAITAVTLDAPTAVTGTRRCTALLLPRVDLSWTADTDAAGQVVWRSTTSGGTATQIGTTTNTSFTDATVLAGSTYYYSVSSTAGSWTSARSAEVKVVVPLTCL